MTKRRARGHTLKYRKRRRTDAIMSALSKVDKDEYAVVRRISIFLDVGDKSCDCQLGDKWVDRFHAAEACYGHSELATTSF